MAAVEPEAVRGLPPQVLLLLVLLCVTSGLAALLLGSQYRSWDRRFPRPLVPDPLQPATMLAFVALPSFLLLVTLVVRTGVWIPRDPVNRPHSRVRYGTAPGRLVLHDEDSPQRYGYPPDTADQTVQSASRVGAGSAQERADAVRGLAWWTGVCPGYAPFTIQRLVAALSDPDIAVRRAAVDGLGSAGGHAASAIPGLRAARGTSVPYFNHRLAEAVWLIERSGTWPAEDVCEDVPVAELERRLVELR